ncbi:S-adenosylmethionine:tRNA ribosyltransferase-isomerase [Sinomonas sp. ASV322]|uniref:S-adenosylmethionine:tRNA ribosyltransferase-isomerase n=1 Tax=Sinomonas sp. ASV322 TaxID=3041920 RepID=UPI0027DDD90F|nr:S-adenosylmethionine:tRNA ribosyltransferase-isomerase [Sinomonas sp. ASV322]MDQ4501985.1 S-adenosylmethionine:tRNA ribosyltransferase-isomerase [Sinomonas sp. ASV322]
MIAAKPIVDFALPRVLEASEPPEQRGGSRDDVRLLVSRRSSLTIEHHRFTDLPEVLRAGDLLVFNRSATVNAALEATALSQPAVLHVARRLSVSEWIVELRHAQPGSLRTTPWLDAHAGSEIALRGGGRAVLLRPAVAAEAVRLWVADVELDQPPDEYMARWGRPIVYGHITTPRPLGDYQTVFADVPGSAEMPSAGRPFTAELVTRLLVKGVDLAPIVLHCGVSSLETHEPPQPEPFEVPPDTSRRVNAALRAGGRVIAVGTTSARALESAAIGPGLVLPFSGLTNLVIELNYSPRVTTGLLTGWHEPLASHLAMVEAFAGGPLLEASYRAALEAGYLWHEFGDSHLILP